MKFGLREICDVVLKARAPMKVGRKVFYKDEPVLYFDTLKTSTLEGAASTVYATGGRGNTRLVAWDGERTVTFTMEDALISPESLMILTGAGLIEASPFNTIKQHMIEQTDDVEYVAGVPAGTDANGDPTTATEECAYVYLKNKPYMGRKDSEGKYLKDQHYIYVMGTKLGEVSTEPYLPVIEDPKPMYYGEKEVEREDGTVETVYAWLEHNEEAAAKGYSIEKWQIKIAPHDYGMTTASIDGGDVVEGTAAGIKYTLDSVTDYVEEHIFRNVFRNATVVVDYYVEKSANTKQIEISADTFAGNFYLEASTLFRTQDGVDLPAEFIIPNCKMQSNFTFNMAATGDPSTFTFTMDAFPAYTRFDSTQKVLCAIQIIEDVLSDDLVRTQTFHSAKHDYVFDNSIHNY